MAQSYVMRYLCGKLIQLSQLLSNQSLKIQSMTSVVKVLSGNK